MRTLLHTALVVPAILLLAGSQLAVGSVGKPHPVSGKRTLVTHFGKALKAPPKPGKTPPPKPAPASSVLLTDTTWTCDGPVDLDSVTITMTTAVIGNRREEDAVHLRPGCT